MNKSFVELIKHFDNFDKHLTNNWQTFPTRVFYSEKMVCNAVCREVINLNKIRKQMFCQIYNRMHHVDKFSTKNITNLFLPFRVFKGIAKRILKERKIGKKIVKQQNFTNKTVIL